jgi:hypothetical protein
MPYSSRIRASAYNCCPQIFICPLPYLFNALLWLLNRNLNGVIVFTIHYTLRVTIEAMVNAERPPLNMAFKSSTNNDIVTDFTFLLSALKHPHDRFFFPSQFRLRFLDRRKHTISGSGIILKNLSEQLTFTCNSLKIL